jgi:hypothetical protein
MANDNQESVIIPEDIQISIKLEEIFTPKFRKQREGAFNISSTGDTEKYARFVHYTSAEAALNIIRSKHMWMRKTSCMSDYLEVEHGIDILRKLFEDKSNFTMFTEALDACVLGAAKEAIELFYRYLDNRIRSSTYIASISEHIPEEDLHGRLSMWRAFHGNTARVAIVFKIPWVAKGLPEAKKALHILFSPVAYMTKDDYQTEFNQIVNNININQDMLRSIGQSKIVDNVFNMLLMFTVCLKHFGFREEKEWRVMYFPNLWDSPLMKSEISTIGGIPQKIYKLPLDASVSPILADIDLSCIFDRLIIGPTQYSWAMFEAFSKALSDIGVQDVHTRICVSNIPIRT